MSPKGWKMKDPVDIPEPFLNFIKDCKMLIKDIWQQRETREDFVDFEVAFERYKKRKVFRFSQMSNFAGYYGIKIQEQREKERLAKMKKPKVTQRYHHRTCCKSLHEIKKSLKLYNVKRHFLSLYNNDIDFIYLPLQPTAPEVPLPRKVSIKSTEKIAIIQPNLQSSKGGKKSKKKFARHKIRSESPDNLISDLVDPDETQVSSRKFAIPYWICLLLKNILQKS